MPIFLFGHEEEKAEPLLIGNFSVPLVTQISPLISFGQLLIGEKALLPQVTGAYALGHNSYADVIAPNVTYGIRDDLSVFFSFPSLQKAGRTHPILLGSRIFSFRSNTDSII